MKKLLIISFLLLSSLSAFAGSIKVEASKEAFLQNAAHVDYVQYLKGQDVDAKIFSVSGGDPAMNGAHLNLAVFVDMETGWNVFELANVRDFEVLPSSKKGFLKIKLLKDTINENGDIVQERSILFVNFTKAEKGTIETEEVKQK